MRVKTNGTTSVSTRGRGRKRASAKQLAWRRKFVQRYAKKKRGR